MEIILKDEQGNTKTMNDKEVKDHLYAFKPLQDLFIPCEKCGLIVLYDYTNTLEPFSQSLCLKCL